MKSGVIVIGSSNTDMVIKVPHIPQPGETVLGTQFITAQGGKGANQAVAAARAGAKVTFISCIGNDTFGEVSVNHYLQEKIDTSGIKTQVGTPSGIALINVAENGENSISVAPGANSFLYPEDIHSNESVFGNACVVLAQLEIPLRTVEAAAEMAMDKKIPFILNPAPALNIPDKLFEKIQIITPNQTEAMMITQRNKGGEDELLHIADDLINRGVQVVIITLGVRGVFVKGQGIEELFPAYPVSAVDTTAAGDVFNGVLAAALAQNVPLVQAVDVAQRAAAISVTRLGAQTSAPGMNEIRDYSSDYFK